MLSKRALFLWLEDLEPTEVAVATGAPGVSWSTDADSGMSGKFVGAISQLSVGCDTKERHPAVLV